MDKTIHLSVTETDIKHGCPAKSDNCPVAISLTRATGAVWVSVNCGAMHWLMAGGAQYKVDTPRVVADWISRYDKVDLHGIAANDMSPFEFDIVPLTLEAWQAHDWQRMTANASRPRLGMMPCYWGEPMGIVPSDAELLPDHAWQEAMARSWCPVPAE